MYLLVVGGKEGFLFDGLKLGEKFVHRVCVFVLMKTDEPCEKERDMERRGGPV